LSYARDTNPRYRLPPFCSNEFACKNKRDGIRPSPG